jgi:hypothetical protein
MQARGPLPAPVPGAPTPEEQDLAEAASLLARRGDGGAFAALLAELRDLLRTDLRRFAAAWMRSFPETRRDVELSRLGINDDRALPVWPWASTGMRVSDIAAVRLQQRSVDDFGWQREAPEQERDAAIARARAWLQEHKGN